MDLELLCEANNTHTRFVVVYEVSDLTVREADLSLGGEITLCYTIFGYFSTPVTIM